MIKIKYLKNGEFFILPTREIEEVFISSTRRFDEIRWDHKIFKVVDNINIKQSDRFNVISVVLGNIGPNNYIEILSPSHKPREQIFKSYDLVIKIYKDTLDISS